MRAILRAGLVIVSALLGASCGSAPAGSVGIAPPRAVGETRAARASATGRAGAAAEPGAVTGTGAVTEAGAVTDTAAVADTATDTAAVADTAADTAAASEAAVETVAGLPQKVSVRWDQAVLVAHAPRGERRVIVYLHGKCGDATAFRAWAPAAARYGTLISIVGDTKCRGGWRSTWSHDIAGLDRRVRAAIEAVGAARGAPLDGEAVTLVGYSLGATRAESLARLYPQRYPRAILIGGPTTPEAASFGGATAVVLMAGALDRRKHLQDAAEAIAAAGIPARFLVLPGARHGEYGPEGERVLGEALRWAFDKAP